ncbi:hypothetical protein [Pedobacter namyangjuensis]|uniref:hypothetical protein n=1 Tax=Pedobacter namyangjuensis TaxID=600626 RepID=UPI000DE1D2A6|nr:hypothetical protein [Pedobacter namyangjuensis]
MTARKIFKVIAIFIAIIIGVILLLVAFVWGSVEWNQYSSKKEAIRMQKEVCDTITTVDGKLPIYLGGFSKKELKEIRFYLQQNKLLAKDTVVSAELNSQVELQTVILPFEHFNINDKLIVYVGKRYYVLSGFSYTAGYNYGMFGPVGSCECRGGGYEKINGQDAGSGTLIKKYGLINYQLPPR